MEFGSLNQRTLREVNTGQIMRIVLEHGPLARSDLTVYSGLAPSTVTKIVAELEERQYVRNHSKVISEIGRPKTLLEINPDGGYFIGIELNAPNSQIGVLDLTTKLVHWVSFRTSTDTCLRYL